MEIDYKVEITYKKGQTPASWGEAVTFNSAEEALSEYYSCFNMFHKAECFRCEAGVKKERAWIVQID